MSFWSVHKIPVIGGMLLTGALALTSSAYAHAPGGPIQAPAQAERDMGSAPSAAPTAHDKAVHDEQDDGGDPAVYLALLACAIVVARQIRRRGPTNVVLS